MSEQQRFKDLVGRKVARRLRARHRPDSVWLWLGLLGLIGWSVAVPTVLGIVLGTWLDQRFPARFSWVLSLMVVGLLVGIFNAWFWVIREAAEREPDGTDVPSTGPEEDDDVG